MVVPLVLAAYVAGGVVSSIASGYVIDKAIGDGNYTKREMLADGVLGAFGFSLAKSGAKVVGGLRHAQKASRVDDISDMKAGFAVARSGVIEIQAARGLENAVTSTRVPTQSRNRSSPGRVGSKSGRSNRSAGASSNASLRRGRGRRQRKSKAWCRRHKRYDYC